LVTLLALSVIAGALGREWMTPPNVTHGTWVPGLVGAGASIVMNNLPAASLLASHGVPSPVPLLIGLDLGPNLFVTGSLAWVLWWRAIRHTGLAPSLSRAVLISATSAIVAIPVALAVYALTT
jgi:arsenical pump membrane protein